MFLDCLHLKNVTVLGRVQNENLNQLQSCTHAEVLLTWAMCSWDIFMNRPDRKSDTHSHTQKVNTHGTPTWIFLDRICNSSLPLIQMHKVLCCRRTRLSNLPASLVKETASVLQTVSVKQLEINILCCTAVNISPPKHGSSASKLQIFRGNYPHLSSVQRIHALPPSFITLPEGESCSVGSDDDYVLAEASTISSYFFFSNSEDEEESIRKTASSVFRIKWWVMTGQKPLLCSYSILISVSKNVFSYMESVGFSHLICLVCVSWKTLQIYKNNHPSESDRGMLQTRTWGNAGGGGEQVVSDEKVML